MPPPVPEIVTKPDVAQSRAAHRLVTDAADADGVTPLSEQSVMVIDAPEDAGAVRHVIIGEVAYANIIAGRAGEPAMIEAVVSPAHRRNGFGRALLESAFAEAAAITDAAPRVWAHGDLPGAVALAAAMGLARRRELLQLRRPLTTALDPLVVPDDIELRTYAGESDDAEILRVNNAAFDWHPEQGGWTLGQIRERVTSDWFDPAGLFLAFDVSDPKRLLGFHWTKVHRDQGAEPLGEVYIVGVDPTTQGRGLGRLLTLAGLHHLAEQGIGEVELYVEGDNTAALHTYDRLGFSQYAIDVAYG